MDETITYAGILVAAILCVLLPVLIPFVVWVYQMNREKRYYISFLTTGEDSSLRTVTMEDETEKKIFMDGLQKHVANDKVYASSVTVREEKK